jgi:Tol biopolymer transport system component
VRQWISGGAQAALAMTAAIATTLVLVTLAGRGLLDRTPDGAPAGRDSLSSVAQERQSSAGQEPGRVATPVATTGHDGGDGGSPRVTPATSTRVVSSRSGGSPAEILNAAIVGRDAFSPSYAHNGNAIYFHAGRAGASLMRAAIDPDGRVTDVATVLNDGASNYHVTASPNGTQIAFDSDRGGVRGVYVAAADGSGARRVSGPGYAAVPSWSPDGRRLAFIKSEPGRRNVWNVWVVDLPGGVLHRVTNHTSGQAWGASWFPDGKHIAYSREKQLVIADLIAGTATAIGSPIRGHLVRTPAVSPDGARVIFQVSGDGAWMLDVARQRVRRVLADRSAEEFVWSPDGHRIAYHSVRNGQWAVWTMASGA